MTNASAVSRMINKELGKHLARVMDITYAADQRKVVIVECYSDTIFRHVESLLASKGLAPSHWAGNSRVLEVAR